MIGTNTPLSSSDEAIVNSVIGCAITVNRTLGPGFKECIYHQAYRLELHSRGLPFESEKKILVAYRAWSIPGQQIDLIVSGIVLVELKAVPRLRELHRRQVVSYLRTTGLRVGLLLNFNARTMKEGLQRIVR
jgi:GxxExxY protein